MHFSRKSHVWFQQYLEGKKGFWGIRLLFQIVSRCFQSVVWLRHKAFDLNILKQKKIPVCVVSVGNIIAGGAGKTPLSLLLVEKLSAHFKVSVLLRGYRSEIEKKGMSWKLSSGAPASFCGDEPLLFYERFPHLSIIVGKHRLLSAKIAMQKGANLLLLDDGMQHRYLKRDFEIVALSGEDPLGRGAFLPKGYLRDDPKRLSRADLLVVTDCRDKTHLREVQQRVAPYSQAPLIGMQFFLKSPEIFRGKKVGLFCGIARPHRVVELLKRENALIVADWMFDDHGEILSGDLKQFAQKAEKEGAEFLVCTEKDWVRLPLNCTVNLNILPLRGDLHLVEGHEAWEAFLNRIVGYERRI
jgi:tetraacyldisaccharide 4'-kinase